jgi:hypothetical protein
MTLPDLAKQHSTYLLTVLRIDSSRLDGSPSIWPACSAYIIVKEIVSAIRVVYDDTTHAVKFQLGQTSTLHQTQTRVNCSFHWQPKTALLKMLFKTDQSALCLLAGTSCWQSTHMLKYYTFYCAVDHEILINVMGRWFASRDAVKDWFHLYLTGLIQVYHAGFSSILTRLVCGVPQGSIIGPSQFTAYTNNVEDIIHMSYHLYADLHHGCSTLVLIATTTAQSGHLFQVSKAAIASPRGEHEHQRCWCWHETVRLCAQSRCLHGQ